MQADPPRQEHRRDGFSAANASSMAMRSLTRWFVGLDLAVDLGVAAFIAILALGLSYVDSSWRINLSAPVLNDSVWRANIQTISTVYAALVGFGATAITVVLVLG